MGATNATEYAKLKTYNPTDTTSYDDFNENMQIIDGSLLSNPSAEGAVDHITLRFNPALSIMLEPAQGTNDGQVGHAGVMTSLQATQLATLAEAYRNATQGIILYQDTASTNYVELSESANNYDHLVVVGEFMGTGSAAVKQTVSTEFHPTADTRAMQFNAIDITTGSNPSETTLQDIWSLNEDGTELELVMAQRCTKMANTLEVTPDTTSIFTITKVVGYGKKA